MTQVKTYYNNDLINDKDIFNISRATTKEDELFDYAGLPDYYKTKNKDKYQHQERKKDDFDISL